MTDIAANSNPGAAGWLRGRWNRAAAAVGTAVGDAILALLARISIAAIFFHSGRTKVDGLLTVNDGAVFLFEHEYQVPLLSPALAAHLATYAEHLLPLLLVLGLFTRLSALGLLTMTAVIQFFVYPGAWPTHLSWATLLLFLIARGAGVWSADQRLGIR